MFFTVGPGETIPDPASLLALKDENMVIAATEGARCFFVDGYFCSFEESDNFESSASQMLKYIDNRLLLMQRHSRPERQANQL